MNVMGVILTGNDVSERVPVSIWPSVFFLDYDADDAPVESPKNIDQNQSPEVQETTKEIRLEACSYQNRLFMSGFVFTNGEQVNPSAATSQKTNFKPWAVNIE